MVITLGTDLEAVLKEAARTQGVSPEELVMKTLRERLSRPNPSSLAMTGSVASSRWEATAG